MKNVISIRMQDMKCAYKFNDNDFLFKWRLNGKRNTQTEFAAPPNDNCG